jgi:predicted TPR repeat methyltransferase
VKGNFNLYSQYYDLLYQDKDYEGEATYVSGLLNKYSEKPVSSLLELGSGTGIHASLMAAKGIDVHGIELSETMLATAKEKEKIAPNDTLSFAQGDARSYRADRYFDAVMSLFHVLSYQTTDDDLQAMITTAATHLKAGGIFMFDFWYGPAVLWQRPSQRVKRWENDAISIMRVAEPVLHDMADIVDVNYTIIVTDKQTGAMSQVYETHNMRYLFLAEVDRLLSIAGFTRLAAEEWMTGKFPSTDTWGVCVVARKGAE